MDITHPLAARFIALVTEWNCPGWGEYLLWETLEGFRDKPFPLLEPLKKEDMKVLRQLRDDHKSWLFYDGTTNTWEVVDISVWRDFAKTTTADDIRKLMDRR